jgi:uncharacterized protein (DUF1684 family)
VAQAGLVCALAVSACTSGPPPPEDTRPYEEQVLAARTETDAFLRSGAQSPLPEPMRASFPGLPYFPIDRRFRVPAALTAESTGRDAVITLPTSANQTVQMRRIGKLAFTIQNTRLTLTAFAEGGSLARLFVPFYDGTNGKETYGGGRYLNLERTATGLYDLDFNRAYHPYCVYNPSYECPVPPRENRVPFEIRAGERLPAAGDAGP